jgi:peptidoglycan/LPS O-acetylase OafA/YrhL
MSDSEIIVITISIIVLVLLAVVVYALFNNPLTGAVSLINRAEQSASQFLFGNPNGVPNGS